MSDSAPSSRPFVIDDVVVRHRNDTRSAMVITPRQPMVIDRERVRRLKIASSLSAVELWLLDQARQRGEGGRLVLFRAVDAAGRRVWQFDPQLSEPEATDAGYVLARALLPFHRRLLAGGTVMMVHTDWGLRECYAMRDGGTRLAEELKASADQDATTAADRFILRNMLLHVALDLDHVVEKLLPEHLATVDRRWPRVQQLIAALPPQSD